MKIIKWKSLVISGLMCLMPIFSGLIMWDKLPDTIAIHFDINNNPDNFASKAFVVFGLPLIMMMLQAFICIVTDINSHKYGKTQKLEKVSKWIIPVVTVVLYISTLGYSVGWNVDIRRIAVLIVSFIFILTGSILPEMDYVKNYKIDKEKAKKINKTMGISMVCLGVLFFLSIFLPIVATVACLLLIIPYSLFNIIYAIIVVKKQ